jgi:hypothetical protein
MSATKSAGELIRQTQGGELVTDEELRACSYGILYADYSSAEADAIGLRPGWFDVHRELRLRLKALQEADRAALRARAAARQVGAPAKATRKCLRCGAPATMNASHGPACPDHYDELSD